MCYYYIHVFRQCRHIFLQPVFCGRRAQQLYDAARRRLRRREPRRMSSTCRGSSISVTSSGGFCDECHRGRPPQYVTYGDCEVYDSDEDD